MIWRLAGRGGFRTVVGWPFPCQAWSIGYLTILFFHRYCTKPHQQWASVSLSVSQNWGISHQTLSGMVHRASDHLFFLHRHCTKPHQQWAPVQALKLPTISICTVFQGEAIGDDGKSPKPLFWVETASFWVEAFDGFLVEIVGAPNK